MLTSSLHLSQPNRVELRQDGRIVGEHRRCFGREQTVSIPGTMCRFWPANLVP